MNWSEFQQIEYKNCELRTNKHKTGKVYTVHTYTQPDQRQFLKLQREKFIDEFKVEPKFIFASSKTAVDGTICHGLQEVFQQYFGDDPQKVRFNANSIRKFWERMWTNIKGQVSEGVNRAHFAQTAHSEKTAHERYLSRNGIREERNQVLDIYLDRLKNRHNSGAGVHTSPPNEEVNSDFEDDVSEGESSVPSTLLLLPPLKRFNVLRDSLQICNSTASLPSCPQQGISQQVDPQSNRPQTAQQPAQQPAPQPAQHPAPQPCRGQKQTRPPRLPGFDSGRRPPGQCGPILHQISTEFPFETRQARMDARPTRRLPLIRGMPRNRQSKRRQKNE